MSTGMELTGTIKLIKDTQKISGTFCKREFVVTVSGEYPQDIQLEFTQDNCEQMDLIDEGQEVNVQFNLRGRCWQSPQGEEKYFNTLQAWKITITENNEDNSLEL
jgi:hypothetical protein